ncbi:acetate/propionate family kinase [Mycoplasma crocodyli]|uniref:Acetate kinase n=1 Tax=Mycoplasma crocodyli (strain ATCC 51981 / MP145) TaxID=512564 RepID=D5E5V5_MYCCM|nr:acetate/propionate family kinase [Mycoplasma crocodyli]ADE19739.1 acetate kinase [Mycoplasma crocodyli MP145]
MSKILVINAGSSSIKLSLFNKSDFSLIANGIAERITLEKGNITIKFGKKYEFEAIMPNHKVAVEKILEIFDQINLVKDKKEIEYIGFRVVQGGPYFAGPSKLTDKEIALIDKVSIYAPLHNPGAVMAMKAFKEVMPHAKMSANFDTAFHMTIDKVNSTYPIPYQWTEEYGVKRYGAHGISHKYITNTIEKILNKTGVTYVNLHIGNGASLCAIKDSKSFDTSMGLTPLAGIMMGSRSGDIDPSIHEFIVKQTHMDISQVTDVLNKKSGLLGVSGISSDMRDVSKNAKEGNERAKFALDLYAQRIADYLSIYLNKIGPKIDAVVFTAGVGENDFNFRQNVINKINIVKLELDSELNQSKIDEYKVISSKNSSIPVYVIRTNEELLIANDAIKLYEGKK